MINGYILLIFICLGLAAIVAKKGKIQEVEHMGYIRKTEDVYSIMGNYGSGFEEVTTEETMEDAQQTLKDYRDNEPQYSFYIKKSRIRKEQ